MAVSGSRPSIAASEALGHTRSEPHERALTERSAVELAAMIRRGEVTARTVLEEHLDRLAVSDSRVHGIVAHRYAEAREAADEADRIIAAADPGDELPPLLGVPCTIKESIAVAGMPHTAGFRPARGRIASEHAPAVKRLIEAGAIPVGVTNTSELCLWVESRNKNYPTSTNPYDITRTVGGSSGGEGAVIGAGGVPIGLGSDLAGSIRVPAFCCGVFGHKPSEGVVSTSGHFPVGSGSSRRMMVVGPLSRRAEDLYPLMKILNADDPDDPYDREIDLADPAEVPIAGMRVLIPEGLGVTTGISRDLLMARERAALHLASKGAVIERTDSRGFVKGLVLYIEALRSSWNEEFTTSLGWEARRVRELYADMARGRSQHTPAFVNLVASVRLAGLVRRAAPEGSLDAAIQAIGRDLTAKMGDGVMLLPPMPRTAPPHGWTISRPWVMETMVHANLHGFPATQAPLGIDGDGLPLGVQVMAPLDQDHRTIAVAMELERGFGGWVPPEHVPHAPAPAVAHHEARRLAPFLRRVRRRR